MMFDVDAPGVDLMKPTLYTIKSKRREIDGVVTLSLAPRPDGPILKKPFPGQFAMLYAFGVGEIPVSFSALSGRDDRLIFTIRNTGAVSAALTKLKRNDAIGVRGPFGAAWPIQALADRDVVILAGGLGLAPLRSVIKHLASKPKAARSVTILYGARDPNSILFHQDLQKWRNMSGVDVRITVDSADAEWPGEVGLVTNLIPKSGLHPQRTTAFLCGPEVMMRVTAEALIDAGAKESSVWLSMERNMKCATGFCGHCQFGPRFICKDGPVLRYDHIRRDLFVREL